MFHQRTIRFSLVMALATASWAGIPRPAAAQQDFRHSRHLGATCQPQNDEDDLIRAGGALGNNSSSRQNTVFCPVIWLDRGDDGAGFASQAAVAYEDHNNNTGAAASVSCRAVSEFAFGSKMTTPFINSCGSFGGCSDTPRGQFTGTLIIDFAFGSWPMGDTRAASAIECRIPSSQVGNGLLFPSAINMYLLEALY
jgi:hypothetical protein